MIDETLEPNRNVFINCPYDEQYWPYLDAISFTLQACGFNPRCALETMDSGKGRIDRIYDIISESRFSIHDLSRVSLSPAGLPRMNMPLELGIFLGARRYGGSSHGIKTCVVLDVDQYRYHRYISDVSGQDIHNYNSEISRLILILRQFLSEFVDGFLPGDIELNTRYEQYRTALPFLCEKLKLTVDALSFSDRRKIIYQFLKASQATPTQEMEIAYKLAGLNKLGIAL
jgi:hypothetical protein